VLILIALPSSGILFHVKTPERPGRRLNIGGQGGLRSRIEKWKTERGYDKRGTGREGAGPREGPPNTVFWDRSGSIVRAASRRSDAQQQNANRPRQRIKHQKGAREACQAQPVCRMFILR